MSLSLFSLSRGSPWKWRASSAAMLLSAILAAVNVSVYSYWFMSHYQNRTFTIVLRGKKSRSLPIIPRIEADEIHMRERNTPNFMISSTLSQLEYIHPRNWMIVITKATPEQIRYTFRRICCFKTDSFIDLKWLWSLIQSCKMSLSQQDSNCIVRLGSIKVYRISQIRSWLCVSSVGSEKEYDRLLDHFFSEQ